MIFIGLLLLVGFAASVPTPSTEQTIYVTEKWFPEYLKLYTSEHDIVNIMVPLNELNIDEDFESMESLKILFFVQGDYKENGMFDNKGLFVLNRKTREATKLLGNGVDFTAARCDTKNVYFAATDGVYVYNAEKNKAEKYGSFTDNIISIAVTQAEDVIYALTANKELHKVTENGEKKVKVDDVKNAHQIVLDNEDNTYFYDDKKHIHVISKDGIRKIDGLPENPNKITLLRPPLFLDESIPVIVDDATYVVYANGTMHKTVFKLKVHPTAFSMEATMMHYYAYKKSIYEYNILDLVMDKALDALQNYLDAEKENIEEIATRSRTKLRAHGKQ